MSEIETPDIDREEIDANMELARKGIEAMKGNFMDDAETATMDAIANLLILAHESGMGVAHVVEKATAHYLATYMEQMEDDDAEEWLEAAGFPWTGDNDFIWYAARDAITLAGKDVTIPEWGT
jgi:hypothetical protein